MITRKFVDALLLSLAALALVVTLWFYVTDPGYFSAGFAAEDGPVEYATAFFLLVASGVLACRAVSLWRGGRPHLVVLMTIYALMFFVASGEEVSWGQRIFDWETGEFFAEHNTQDETNLHNLAIGEVRLAKTLFGGFLTLVILLYLVTLPLLYRRSTRIARLADRLVVPVPGLRHAVMAILASIVIGAIDIQRQWEVYELVFSLLAVSIFVSPRNDASLR